MQSFENLRVWQLAHVLAVQIATTPEGRANRNGDWWRQLRRAAESIPANIAEGAAFDSRPQFARFLTMAIASSHEVHSHLLLGQDTKRLSPQQASNWIDEIQRIRRMLIRLLRAVQQGGGPGSRGSGFGDDETQS